MSRCDRKKTCEMVVLGWAMEEDMSHVKGNGGASTWREREGRGGGGGGERERERERESVLEMITPVYSFPRKLIPSPFRKLTLPSHRQNTKLTEKKNRCFSFRSKEMMSLNLRKQNKTKQNKNTRNTLFLQTHTNTISLSKKQCTHTYKMYSGNFFFF